MAKNKFFILDFKIKLLVKSRLSFNTVVIIPSNEQLDKWRQCNSNEGINHEYPIRSLENSDKNFFQQFIMKVKAKNIDIALSCMKSWGFNYNKILVPTQNKKGLADVSSEFIIIIGSKGKIINNDLILKSNKTIDLIEYAQKTGIEPFLLIGEVITTKNWTYCVG